MHQRVKVFAACAVVDVGDADGQAAIEAGIGGDGDAGFLHADEDLGVEGVELFV